jgi:hypothetical protein
VSTLRTGAFDQFSDDEENTEGLFRAFDRHNVSSAAAVCCPHFVDGHFVLYVVLAPFPPSAEASLVDNAANFAFALDSFVGIDELTKFRTLVRALEAFYTYVFLPTNY